MDRLKGVIGNERSEMARVEAKQRDAGQELSRVRSEMRYDKNEMKGMRKQYPTNRSEPMIPMAGMAKGGMLFSKKEVNAKNLLGEGKAPPLPHAKGSVNMKSGGKVKKAIGGAMDAKSEVSQQRRPSPPPNMPTQQPSGQYIARAIPGTSSVSAADRAVIEANKSPNEYRKPLTNTAPMQTPTGIVTRPGERSSGMVRRPGGVTPRPQAGYPPRPNPSSTEPRTMGGPKQVQLPPNRNMAKGGMTSKQQAKVGKVMGEFKAGDLHSGKNGPVVKSRKQAIAIGLSEARKAKK